MEQLANLAVEALSIDATDGDRSFRLDVDRFSIGVGEVIGISGPSGTGKTMLLEVLGLLRRPSPGGVFELSTSEGTVDVAAMWDGPDVAREAPALRGAHFGFVPQSGGLLPFLTVSENISLSQRVAGCSDPGWQADLERQLGLAKLGKLHPAALSIGQRQRVAIARALAHRPSFVIADEPTAALDPENATRAMSLLIEAARAGNAAVMISSHDLLLLNQFAMRHVRLALAASKDAHSVRSCLTEVVGETA